MVHMVVSYPRWVSKKANIFLPAVNGLGLAVVGPMIVEEAVTGIGVHVEVKILAVLDQRRLLNGHLFRRGTAVVLAKDAQQRAVKIGCVVEGSHWTIWRQVSFVHDDPATPAVDDGVKAIQQTGRQIGMASTGTGAPYAYFAVADRLVTQKAHCAFNVAHRLAIGYTAPARTAAATSSGVPWPERK